MKQESTSSPVLSFASCNDLPIWRTFLSEHESASVAVAVRLCLFDIIPEEGIAYALLLEKLSLGPRGGEALVAVLCSLGYLQAMHHGMLYNTELSMNYLVSSSPFFWGPMLLLASKTNDRLYHCLMAELATCDPSFGSQSNMKAWESGMLQSEEQAERIAAAMHSHSLGPSIAVAKNVNLIERFGIKGLLDIGGGSGCFSIAIAAAHPTVRCTVLELATACSASQKYIASARLESAVRTFECNMFIDPFPDYSDPKFGFDTAFLSNILHDWDTPSVELILRKVHEALPAKGTILIHEALLNDAKDGPLLTACFSLHMFLNTKGKQFSFIEMKSLLSGCGFSNIQAMPTFGIYSVVSATK